MHLSVSYAPAPSPSDTRRSHTHRLFPHHIATTHWYQIVSHHLITLQVFATAFNSDNNLFRPFSPCNLIPRITHCSKYASGWGAILQSVSQFAVGGDGYCGPHADTVNPKVLVFEMDVLVPTVCALEMDVRVEPPPLWS